LLTVAIIFAGITFTACEKQIEMTDNNQNEELSQAPNQNFTMADMPEVEVVEGILSFKNEEDYFTAVSILSNTSEKERRDWEKSIGFVSLRTLQENALDEIQNVEDEKVIYQWLEKYKDLFEVVQDENGEKYIEKQNSFYACILSNSDQIIIKNKKQKLVYPNNNNSKLPHRYELIDIKQVSDPPRRVKIQMELIYGRFEQFYHVFSQVEVSGYRLIGLWLPYKTTLAYIDVSGTFQVINSNSQVIGFNIGSYQSPREEYSIYKSNLYFSTAVPSLYPTNIYYLTANGKAYSRGCGNYLAEINYID